MIHLPRCGSDNIQLSVKSSNLERLNLHAVDGTCSFGSNAQKWFVISRVSTR